VGAVGFDPVQLAEQISKLSPLGIAILIVFLVGYVFYKKWLVFGSYHVERVTDLEERLTKTEEQRDQALDMAAKLTGILEAGRRGSYRGR
jgi:hypothetical protein